MAKFPIFLILFFLQLWSFPIFSEVPPELENYYADNKKEINNLRTRILSDTSSTLEKINSFNIIRAKYSAIVPEIASDILIQDEPVELSTMAVRALSASSVMSNHILVFKKGYKMTDAQKIAHSEHIKILLSLNKAVFHKNREVRLIAARTGGDLSYAPIVESAVKASTSGLLTSKDVVSVIAHSKNEIAAPIISMYLNSKDVDLDAKVAALKAAGRFSQFRDNIMEYALNEKKPNDLRIVAIEMLAGDEKNAAVLTAISLNNNEPPNIVKTAAESYVKTVTLQPKKFTALEIQNVENALKAASSMKGRDKSTFFNSIRNLEKARAQIR